jgi:hypothetical protein
VAGDAIYELTSKGLKKVGVATINGIVTVSFSSDPTFLLAKTPKVTLSSTRVKLQGASIDVSLSCQKGAPCRFDVTASVEQKTYAKSKVLVRTVILAKGNFRLAAGSKKVLQLAMTPVGQSMLDRRGKRILNLHMTLVTAVTGGLRSVHGVLGSTTR